MALLQVLRRNCLESDVKFQILSNPEFLAEGAPATAHNIAFAWLCNVASATTIA